MQAISLWQPYATLLVCGAKKFETRSWKLPERYVNGEWVAIHAAKKWNKDLLAVCRELAIKRLLGQCGAVNDDWIPKLLGFGAIVGAVRFGLDYPTEIRRHLVSDDEIACGDWSDGRYAWDAIEGRHFRDIPCVGRQGFFRLTDEQTHAVARQLSREKANA